MTRHPISRGENLCQDKWLGLRTRAIFDHCKWDVQCEDHSVLAEFPIFLGPETAQELSGLAEALSGEALAAEEELLCRPELLDLLSLSRPIRKTLQHGPHDKPPVVNLRVMRFDFHYTTQGWLISEVNSDVPGGFIEASGWNALFAREWPQALAPSNPSQIYAHAIAKAVGPKGLVALVHATAYSDDRQVMQHLAGCFSQLGLRTCLLSPTHLRWKDGRAEICSQFASGLPDAIVRFFPAEWLPRLSSENSWKPYFRKSQTHLSNPGSAILLQTKRFPLVWDQLRTALPTWRELLPETRKPSEIHAEFDDSWVLKPALGRVGEGIGILGITPPAEFQKIVREARRNPQEWVAQKRFSILPLAKTSAEIYPCVGVFTIGGKAAGFYGRVATQPIISQDARDVAVLIRLGPEKNPI